MQNEKGLMQNKLPSRMIKAIILDWGGVLIDNPVPGFIKYCAEYLKVSEEKFKNIVIKFYFDFSRGLITENTFWKKVCYELNVSEPIVNSLLAESFKSVYSEKDEVIAVISSLKNDGYKIALLSNTETPMVDCFREKKYEFFDVTVFSCIEKTAKPDRKIYEIALDRLAVKPHEAVFVDDKEENIAAAKNIGINTILFKDSDQFKKELFSFLK